MADGRSSQRGPLGERYGGQPPSVVREHGLDALFAHRSVRQYSSEPLPEGTLELIVAAAQSAASSSNLQLWSVLSVEDPGKRAELSEVAGGLAHGRGRQLDPTFALARAERRSAARSRSTA
jgi:nitroreductase